MEKNKLKHFDLQFPGIWIEGTDRDWAFETKHILQIIQSLFIEAVTAFSLFDPITYENIRVSVNKDESPYDNCLNSLYAKAFVFALDGIEKLLFRLCNELNQPKIVMDHYEEYKKEFGHLKHIRDSAIHIEDRGRGKTRSQKPVSTYLLLLGCFNERQYTFTGEDGKQYEIEISETTLNRAKRIIQNIIDSFIWE